MHPTLYEQKKLTRRHSLAYGISVGVCVARLHLQHACDRLPHWWLTACDVQHRYVHQQHAMVNGAIPPQHDVVTSSCICSSVAATKQLCRAIVKVGAIGQTTAAQLTWLINFRKTDNFFIIKYTMYNTIYKCSNEHTSSKPSSMKTELRMINCFFTV